MNKMNKTELGMMNAALKIVDAPIPTHFKINPITKYSAKENHKGWLLYDFYNEEKQQMGCGARSLKELNKSLELLAKKTKSKKVSIHLLKKAKVALKYAE